jgi:hypothetical protein
VALSEIEPPIWRRVSVPDNYSLHQLHRVLQLLLGWLDYHLYEFRAGERRFEAPDQEAEHEDSTMIDLASLKLEVGARFEYVYDFGDYWVHELTVEEIFPVNGEDMSAFPHVRAGERAGPHEDSGGPTGHAELVKALRNRRHREHQDLRDWAGPNYEPERFDPWLANRTLILAAAWGAI